MWEIEKGVINCKFCLSDEWEEEEVEEDNDSDGSWVDVSHSEGEAVSVTVPAKLVVCESQAVSVQSFTLHISPVRLLSVGLL